MDFPKSARVRTRGEYLNFFKGSQVKRLGECILFRVSNTVGNDRLGITIKARVNSVYRNKVKRQIRESFRLNRIGLAAHDYNVVVPNTIRVDYRSIKRIRKLMDSVWKNETRF